MKVEHALLTDSGIGAKSLRADMQQSLNESKEKYTIHETASQTTILDSGERTEFNSGAVRDIQKGKGRCDLLPLGTIMQKWSNLTMRHISDFMSDRNVAHLWDAYHRFIFNELNIKMEEVLLELSIHFEEGAEKYGERNWEKGLPVDCYINSAIRHYLKWLRGDTDERHDRAVLWNLICCIWTIENIKEG